MSSSSRANTERRSAGTARIGWTDAELTALRDAAERLSAGFADLPAAPGPATDATLTAVLLETATRLQDNFPYFHTRYVGQMLKPPHPVARLAYALAMLINPNNHALDGGRASSRLEREAVAELAAMIGWSTHLGHLTSGGTMANLEALWVAGRLAPGSTVVASDQAHYTHARISGVLGLDYESVASDRHGRLDIGALMRRLEAGNVGTVVVTLGTTAFGAVDPLDEILALRRQHGFRLHVDAAYGGYFRLAGETLGPPARRAFAAMDAADSVVVDPHKHGLQPYGCGAVLFADPGVARFYRHDSPYTYFTPAAGEDLHLGEITLECSRAGAAATALWATQRLLPLVPGGAFAADLVRCLQAARALHRRLQGDARAMVLAEPDLDIVVWAPAAADAAEVSAASRRVFDAAARLGLHLALTQVPAAQAAAHWPDLTGLDGVANLTCLRCCLMKPEHLDEIDTLWALLDQALQHAVGGTREPGSV